MTKSFLLLLQHKIHLKQTSPRVPGHTSSRQALINNQQDQAIIEGAIQISYNKHYTLLLSMYVKAK